MCLRDVLLFLAGAEFFHTISHGLLYWTGTTFDLKAPIAMAVTPQINLWNMIINGAITIILLVFVGKLSKKPIFSNTNL